MTLLPLMLDGASFSAVIIGGGAVAERRTRSLLDAGVPVRIIAPEINEALRAMAAVERRLILVQRAYDPTDVRLGTIIVAATNNPQVNTRVATDAKGLGRLVTVASDPNAGNFVMPSVHRSGDVTISVSTVRVPAAAAAIRHDLARRFDSRYAMAVSKLRDLRDRLLRAGNRDEWKRASADLIGEDFCDSVEQGTLEARITAWR